MAAGRGQAIAPTMDEPDQALRRIALGGVAIVSESYSPAKRGKPPRMTFPALPQLPLVPDLVDSDCWMQVRDGLQLVRKMRRDGTVFVDVESYYVSRALAGWG